jgi:rod shape-determining protein MreC
VENSATGAFGGVVCQPLAGIDRHRQLLILMSLPELPPRPQPEPDKPLKKSQLPKMTPIKEGAVAPAPASAIPATPTAPARTTAPAAAPAGAPKEGAR